MDLFFRIKLAIESYFYDVGEDNYNEFILPIKNDDQIAFRELFNQMYPTLNRYIFSLINDHVLSEEFATDVFIAIWKNRKIIQIDHSLKAYLYRSARNKAYDYFRSKEYKKKYDSLDDHAFHLVSNVKTEDLLNYSELQTKILNCVSKLPKRSRMIFSLSRFAGFPRSKIAEELDITVKTVENQITRALKFMMSCVYDEEIGGGKT